MAEFIKKDGFTQVIQKGRRLSFAESGVKEQDGLFFRKISDSDELKAYEDWRLPAAERAAAFSKELSPEEIAGMMLFSPHQMVPAPTAGPFPGTYDGKAFDPEKQAKEDLSDQQKVMLSDTHIRHILQAGVEDAVTSAKWANKLQAEAEKLPNRIPVVVTTDPRHGASASAVEFKSGTNYLSKWPEGIGMAATFDPQVISDFAEVASKEYRLLGISSALGPQIDLATEPRWMRMGDTFGTDSSMAIEFTKRYVDGMQTTSQDAYEQDPGWGTDSVAAMIKHWPGGGPEEAGRDGHYGFGAYSVYPGNNFDEHLKVFTDGGLSLEGPTKKSAAVMPYYTVSWDSDKKYGTNRGNSYNTYLIKDLLREKYAYDGVVCTDWGITGKAADDIWSFSARCYGEDIAQLPEGEQILILIENGVDQLGGNSDIVPVLDAFERGYKKYGKEAFTERIQLSAQRLLTNMFRLGLFDDPYVDPEETAKYVGCEEFRKAGYRAQQKSIVVVKNKNNVLPLKKGIKVYVPERQVKEKAGFMLFMVPGFTEQPVTPEEAEGYFTLVSDPAEADAAFVWMESPESGKGYSPEDRASGGNGYVPLSLQYRPYTAEYSREVSIAGGDYRETTKNRTYKGKTTATSNECDLDNVLRMKEVMGDKPVIALMALSNPVIPAEFEPFCDAIVLQFGAEKRAMFDLVFGDAPWEGKLPYHLPKDMKTVEEACEDLPNDYEPYTDSEGNVYKYGFGLQKN